MALVNPLNEEHSCLCKKKSLSSPFPCAHTTMAQPCDGAVPVMMFSIAVSRWLWKHQGLTVPKTELFSLFVHEILHRAHQLVRYSFTMGFNDLNLCWKLLPCVHHPTLLCLPHWHYKSCLGFFFASLVVWRFFLGYCLAQSGLKFDCISLCTHWY